MVVVEAVAESLTVEDDEEDADPPVATSPSVWGCESINVKSGPATMLPANCVVMSLKRGCPSVLLEMKIYTGPLIGGTMHASKGNAIADAAPPTSIWHVRPVVLAGMPVDENVSCVPGAMVPLFVTAKEGRGAMPRSQPLMNPDAMART